MTIGAWSAGMAAIPERANKLNSFKASTQDGSALESPMTLTRLLAISISTFKENGGEK